MAATKNIYREEIYNFLRTVTIKFDPMVKIVADALLNNVDPFLDIKNNNFYYKRLLGEYIPGDTPMYVNSVDTGEQILFSKENLRLHPRTSAIYKIPNIEYDSLCKKYPHQKDLIKSIVYPVESISLLENSPELAYITGDTSLLQQNEIYEIEDAIRRHCQVSFQRWWVKEYCYEEGYPIAFYSMFWQFLPLVCFTRRMTVLKTMATHPDHVWEYLKSKGLVDYRDVLTTKQSLFLYRNMDYILANKGTANNLLILADQILADFSLTLFGKHIYQEQNAKVDQCIRTPEIISVPIVSYETDSSTVSNTVESLSTINARMYQKGIEKVNTIQYITELETQYGSIEEDRLPTKLIELRKDPVNTSRKNMYVQFIYETLIYRLAMNKLSFQVSFLDTISGNTIKLDIRDAFLLLYYVLHRSAGQTPIYIPKYGTTRIPYNMYKPALTDFPEKLWINEYPYKLKEWIDIPGILSDILWHHDPIRTVRDFNKLINTQFTTMCNHVSWIENNADLIFHRSMMEIYNKCCKCGTYEFPISAVGTTYEEFFNSSETLKNIFSNYDNLKNIEHWEHFAMVLFGSIGDMESEVFKKTVGILESYTTIFDKMTSLLIQLTSHNITFLGTARQLTNYLYVSPFVLHTDRVHGTSTGWIDIHSLLQISKTDFTVAYDEMSLSLSYAKQNNITTTYEKLELNDVTIHDRAYGLTEDRTRFATSPKFIHDTE